MFKSNSNGLKGKVLAFTIAAASLSSAQAFGSSIESPEYGNSAWNWWENSVSTVVESDNDITQEEALTAHPETRSSEFGHVAWNTWNTWTSGDSSDNVNAKSDNGFKEPSPEFGHVAPAGWENS